MPELTLRKQLKIVELYFTGLSYDQIMRKVDAGKGSVVRVVDGLKAGKYPEYGGMSGELEVLREAAVRLSKEHMTPVKAAVGLAVWEGLTSTGVTPEEVPKAMALLRAMAPAESDPGSFGYRFQVVTPLTLSLSKGVSGVLKPARSYGSTSSP